MSEQTRRKLSIAFTTYNKARAAARATGDTKSIEQWNKVLGRLVRDAFRRHPDHRKSTALSLSLA